MLFKLNQYFVPPIGFCFQTFLSPLIIELQYQGGVFIPTFRGGHIFYPMSFPQSTRITECSNTAFSADACSGENDKLFHLAFKKTAVFPPVSINDKITASISARLRNSST